MNRREFLKTALVSGLSLAVPRIILPSKTFGYSTTDSWRFVVMSDLHELAPTNPSYTSAYTCVKDAYANIIAYDKPDLIVMPGDIVEGYTQAATLQDQLTLWAFPNMAPLFAAGIPVYGIRGNHEAAIMVAPYDDRVTGWNAAWDSIASTNPAGRLPQNGPTSPYNERGLTYSFTHNNAMFVCIDQFMTWIQTPPYNANTNQTWLNTQLAAYAASGLKHLFVFGHYAAFEATRFAMMDYLVGDDGTLRNNFWASLVNAHADAFFSGHNHIYCDSLITRSGDPHRVIHVSDGAIRCTGSVPNAPYVKSVWDGPYTLTVQDKCLSDDYITSPYIGGHAIGYMVVEINTKLNSEPRVTYTFKHGTYNTGTGHYTFNNLFYHRYNINSI